MKYTINNSDTEWLAQTYEKLTTKMSAECARVGSKIPFIAQNGHYSDLGMPDGLSWWTNGFWPGLLWQMYHATNDESYKMAAEGVELRLDKTLSGFEGLNHDVGFLFLPSAVANYRVTGNHDSYRRGMLAANFLAGRYNPKGEFIRAWNDGTMNDEDVRGWMIIDCLMNIPLLYWASDVSGDPRFREIAERHAKTAQKYIVRADGSSAHIASFNPSTGEFIGNPGGQGYGAGSSWSRGQGWALYGYALSYRHTGDESYLSTAKQCANYSIASLAVNNWLPLVDFRAPAEPVKYDSAAGLIIACGLLELALHVPELEKKMYVDAALKILRACDDKFNDWNPEHDAIVGGNTMLYHNDRTANLSIIYSDYYLVEALLRLLDKDLLIW